MFSNQKGAQKPDSLPASENGQPAAPAIPLLSVVAERAHMEGKFDIADSIQVECEVGGEMNVAQEPLPEMPAELKQIFEEQA